MIDQKGSTAREQNNEAQQILRKRETSVCRHNQIGFSPTIGDEGDERRQRQNRWGGRKEGRGRKRAMETSAAVAKGWRIFRSQFLRSMALICCLPRPPLSIFPSPPAPLPIPQGPCWRFLPPPPLLPPAAPKTPSKSLPPPFRDPVLPYLTFPAKKWNPKADRTVDGVPSLPRRGHSRLFPRSHRFWPAKVPPKGPESTLKFPIGLNFGWRVIPGAHRFVPNSPCAVTVTDRMVVDTLRPPSAFPWSGGFSAVALPAHGPPRGAR